MAHVSALLVTTIARPIVIAIRTALRVSRDGGPRRSDVEIAHRTVDGERSGVGGGR